MAVQPWDVIRVAQHFVWDSSDTFINVWHYQHQGTESLSDQQVVDGASEEIDDNIGFFVPYQCDELVFGEIELYNVTQDSPMVSGSHPVNTDGASEANPLPTQIALLMLWETGVKRGYGRRYIPGFAVGSLTAEGFWNATLLAAAASYAAGVLAGFSISGNDFVPGHWRRLTEDFLQWHGVIIDEKPRTQRRRVVGVGS